MNSFFKFIADSFRYLPKERYKFGITDNETQNNSNDIVPLEDLNQNVFPSISVNLDYIKVKFNSLINSDIKIREFDLTARNKVYKAFIVYIDGMSNSQSINRFILHPLMLKSRANTFNSSQEVVSTAVTNNITVKKVKKFNLIDYIYSCLIPLNDTQKVSSFSDVITAINAGNCALFVDTIDTCFISDVKGFEKRNIDKPQNEIVIRGSQEAFVETIRTNTSMLRRLVNNENLVIENTSVGVVSKTQCAICYIKDIANNSLVSEVKYRVNNLDIDYIISSGQLESLIKENSKSSLPESLSTERPDTASTALLEGKVVVIVNGSPTCLIMPCTFFDLLESPEDKNLNYKFGNFLKIIRLIACLISILLPGIYIAITKFHEELIPNELLFSIISSRQSVPISIELEIILMEIAFELIHEAGIRVPSPIGSTMSIVGALVLGDAAVSANIVSPISIIIVAITSLSSFAAPNYSLEFHFRILRFAFIFVGSLFGFLGIALGIFLYLAILANYNSFGIPYLAPYIPVTNSNGDNYFLSPIWKREQRPDVLNTKRKNKEAKISMVWKTGGNK